MGDDMAVPELWQGMLDLYSAPGIPEACVNVQDACEADSLLLLTAAILTRSERQMTPDLAGSLVAATAEWRHEVVLPLRALRRRWRGRLAAESLRERVKALELEAERSQVDLLQSALEATSALPGAAAGPALLRSNCQAVLPGGSECPACVEAREVFFHRVAALLWPALTAENPGVAE